MNIESRISFVVVVLLLLEGLGFLLGFVNQFLEQTQEMFFGAMIGTAGMYLLSILLYCLEPTPAELRNTEE